MAKKDYIFSDQIMMFGSRELFEKVSSEIPEWAGVITAGIGRQTAGEYIGLTIKKNAKLLHKETCGPETKDKIIKAMYWKAWNKL